MNAVEKIAATVLYEGYLLWPYRRSAHKNQQRWPFGGIYPQEHSVAHPDDPCSMQTQCLVIGSAPQLTITTRFLHGVARKVGRQQPDGTLEFVDELSVGNQRYLSWEEMTERQIVIPDLQLGTLTQRQEVEIEIPAGQITEPILALDSRQVGALVRTWQELQGTITIQAQALQERLFRLTLCINNTTPYPHPSDLFNSYTERAQTLCQTFVSTHSILQVAQGEFVSLTDPPATLRSEAAACQNLHTWPVLAGEQGATDTLLSSPIILYDYPQIAPESPGDLFDGTEIDQLLLLNILTLSEEEKQEMRATDPRAREILERSEALTRQDFMNLHGAIREFRVLDPKWEGTDPFSVLAELEQPTSADVIVNGIILTPGSRVRLHPRAGGDVFDLMLVDKIALIDAIEQDYEDQVHLAVVLEDDPGRDLGLARMPGHRFFFTPSEVEPI